MSKFFVEIGAANFETLLPLAKSGWSGIVVEPMPHFAAELRTLFSGMRVEVVEAAISDFNGNIDMHVSKNEDWVAGISHVANANHMGVRLRELDGNQELFVDTISVKCMTLDKLLSGVSVVDFMKVDVEGHELNVFLDYSFRVKPTMIKVEHKHVDDWILARKLQTNGYLVWTEKDDIYGVI